jgi:carnitine-CoA ligase
MTGVTKVDNEVFGWLAGRRNLILDSLSWHSQSAPAKPAIEMLNATVDYGEFALRTSILANALSRHGVGPGDRVALFMLNRPEFLVGMIGALKAGAAYSPVSTLLTVDEARYQISDVDPKVIVVDHENLLTVRAALAGSSVNPQVVLLDQAEGSLRAGETTMADFVDHAAPDDPDPAGPEDLALIMYTSGTTARPKGVMLSHGNLACMADNIIGFMNYQQNERILHHLPMFHMNGGLTNTLPSFVLGATLVLVPRFSASSFSRQLHELRITSANVNATHVRILLNTPPAPTDSDHVASRMMQGLTLEPAELQAFEERFRTRLIPTYGLTESLGINVAGSANSAHSLGCAGRVLRGYEVMIAGEPGKGAAQGQAGEILVRSISPEGLSMGYYRQGPPPEAETHPGWLASGDIGRIDADGFLWYVERKRDMIKRSGFNIGAAEVERVIAEVPGVAEVAVVGVPDPMREEAIVAMVVGDADVQNGILRACDEQLAEYKRPQFILFVDDVPKNFLGKVDKKRLREQAIERISAAEQIS